MVVDLQFGLNWWLKQRETGDNGWMIVCENAERFGPYEDKGEWKLVWQSQGDRLKEKLITGSAVGS